MAPGAATRTAQAPARPAPKAVTFYGERRRAPSADALGGFGETLARHSGAVAVMAGDSSQAHHGGDASRGDFEESGSVASLAAAFLALVTLTHVTAYVSRSGGERNGSRPTERLPEPRQQGERNVCSGLRWRRRLSFELIPQAIETRGKGLLEPHVVQCRSQSFKLTGLEAICHPALVGSSGVEPSSHHHRLRIGLCGQLAELPDQRRKFACRDEAIAALTGNAKSRCHTSYTLTRPFRQTLLGGSGETTSETKLDGA